MGDHFADVNLQDIISIVPEEQKHDLSQQSSQLNDTYGIFDEGFELSHPLLIAKQKLRKQTRLKPKAWRPNRKEKDIININGKRQTWRQFKEDFYADLKKKTDKNEVVKRVEFIVDQDLPTEKLLWWHYR